MSSNIFPDLAGLSWERKKTPIWSTKIQKTSSGKEMRSSYFSYPLYQFSLAYEVLRETGEAELQSILGLFNKVQGSFDTFLYTDPNDNAVTAQQFGVGDGVTTKFQLVRTYAGYVEPVKAINGTPLVYKNGVATTLFTISGGYITFATAPTSGQILTWTGNFYFVCRFLQDSIEFNQFLNNLWNAKKVEFVSVK